MAVIFFFLSLSLSRALQSLTEAPQGHSNDSEKMAAISIQLAQLETPIARYKPGQKETSGNSCCFQHIDHLFLGHHHHITGTPSQNDQGTMKT